MKQCFEFGNRINLSGDTKGGRHFEGLKAIVVFRSSSYMSAGDRTLDMLFPGKLSGLSISSAAENDLVYCH